MDIFIRMRLSVETGQWEPAEAYFEEVDSMAAARRGERTVRVHLNAGQYQYHFNVGPSDDEEEDG